MNMKKFSFIMEWIGASIIIIGVVVMALNLNQIVLLKIRHDAFMMFVIALALLCFVPKKYLTYREIQKQKNEEYLPGRRAVIMNVILAVILILVGLLRVFS